MFIVLISIDFLGPGCPGTGAYCVSEELNTVFRSVTRQEKMLGQWELLEERWLQCVLVLWKYSFLILSKQLEWEWWEFFLHFSQMQNILCTADSSYLYNFLITSYQSSCHMCKSKVHQTACKCSGTFCIFHAFFLSSFSHCTAMQCSSLICAHQWLLSLTEDIVIPWEKKKLKEGFINFQRQGKTQETHKSIKVSRKLQSELFWVWGKVIWKGFLNRKKTS